MARDPPPDDPGPPPDDSSRLDRFLRKWPEIKNFAWIVDIETGAIIIGFLGLAFGVIWFFIDIIYLSVVIDLFPQCPQFKKAMSHMRGVLIYDVIIQILLSISFVYLIVGHQKEKPRMVKRWIVSSMFLFVAKIAAAICFLCFNSIFIFLITFIYAGTNIYYTMVVNSYYQTMDDGGRHY